MSTDPHPVAVTAGFAASGPGHAPPVVFERGDALDAAVWCRWWRDLIVERYRFDRFDAFVPLPAAACPWALRVALGRVVEQSMAGVSGPALTTRLVTGALDAAGFGLVRDLSPDARRDALVRAGWCNDPWRGDDDLRLGVLGTIADALLQEVPPTPATVDLRTNPSADAPESAIMSSAVLAATRTAVFAYARHVEDLAHRSRDVVRSYQF